jgi:uncharacterized protein (TIGR01777 family)
MEILVTGSNGLIGSLLVDKLKEEGHTIKCLVRNKTVDSKFNIYWEPENGLIRTERMEKPDAVIHLAGENIYERNLFKAKWTDEKKDKIKKSRIKGTKLLSDALAKLNNPPKVLISASSIRYYGDRGHEQLTEDKEPGKGFLSELCVEWEKSTHIAVKRGIRVVHARFGIVLSPKGGSLKNIYFPFKIGLGGIIGSGKQYTSWVDIEDVIGSLMFILKNDDISGPVNIVSPNPVTNNIYTKTLGHFFKRPTFLKISPKIVNSFFGEMGNELLLSSTRAIPEKLLSAGYKFKYSGLKNSLNHLL